MSTGKEASVDTRRQDRIEVSRPIAVTEQMSGRELGQLVNFSDEGIMLMGSEAIAENSVLQLSLSFDPGVGTEEPINLGVESLWCHASEDGSCHWTGCYIIDISEQDLERLRVFVGQPGSADKTG